MQSSSLCPRLLRAGAVFALLALAASACAQGMTPQTASIETADVEGTQVKLLVPAGYCKLTRDAEPGRSMYTTQDRVQKNANLVVLIFGACAEVAQVKKGAAPGLMHWGIYMAPLKDGHATRLPPAMTRAQALDEVAKAIPVLDLTPGRADSGPSFTSSGVPVKKSITGLLGKDANAAYVGSAADVSNDLRKASFQVVTLITAVKETLVSLSLYAPPDGGALFNRLLATQRAQALALIKVN